MQRLSKVIVLVLALLDAFLIGEPAGRCATLVVSRGVAPELRGQMLREVADPCLGLHWRLVIDPAHPSWPARIVLMEGNGRSPYRVAVTEVRPIAYGVTSSSVTPGLVGEPASAKPEAAALVSNGRAAVGRATVIYAGDPITVDQDTGVLQARLQAVALESAAVGQQLRVRLTVNADRLLGANSIATSLGPVISVVAIQAGRTAWQLSPAAPSLTERDRP